MTLRTRVSLWMGVTLCVVITAMGTALYLSEKALLTRNLEETRQSLVHNFAQTCADASSVHDELAAVNAAETLRRTPGVLDAYCVNTHRLVFAHSNGTLIGKKVDALPPPGPLAHLACYVKQPLDTTEHDLHRQWQLLVDYFDRIRGERPARRPPKS